MGKYCIGIDIGGTKIRGCVADTASRVLLTVERKTEAALGFRRIADNIVAVLDELTGAGYIISAIGVGTAGTVDTAAGKVIYATENLPGYTGFEIGKFLSGRYGVPVAVENDANAALIGEMAYGAAEGLKSAVMLTLGTGVGGAIAIDGQIMHGANYRAGRWGHTVLVPDGRQCTCSQAGCAEMYLSGRALHNGACELGYDLRHGSEIFPLIAGGDEVLIKYFDRYISMLTVLITTVVNAVDPQAIVIGGGVADSYESWWERFLTPKLQGLDGVRVLPAVLKTNAGLLGAVKLAIETVQK